MTIPAVIGHRGAAGHAPENTLASIRTAAGLGVSWVEFDVMLSGDDQPVLFHDDKLNRVTNGRGLTAETPLAELKTLDAGSWFSPAFKGETIATLGEAFALLSELGLGANVEIKPSTGREAITGQVVGREMAKHWPANLPMPLVSSFSMAALEAFAAEAPNVSRALLDWPIPKDWREKMRALDCVAFHAMSSRLRERRAKEVLDAGYDLRSFTVNRRERARQLFGWGLSGVISDFPDRMLDFAR